MARAAQLEPKAEVSVALNLAPMIAPLRKHGRLSLRIERLPQGMRLSRGTRNNDGTWSLASDELDDLALFAPEDVKKVFKIGVRVISLLNGSTLTALELPINPEDESATATVSDVQPAASTAELSLLQRELAAAKEALSARDAELAERLGAAATEAAGQFQHTLAKAESAWTKAEGTRLAAIQQQWQEKFAEALADVEGAQTQQHEAQMRELQEKLETLQAAIDERDAALKHVKDAGHADRERGDSATQEAQAKLIEMQAKLAEREAALARAVASVDAAKCEAEAGLAKAEQIWRDGEAARLAAAEAQWRESSTKALSEAHADANAERAQGTASERDLLHRVAELQAAIAERDEAIARAQSASEQARARASQETDARMAKAEQNWKAAEAARLAATEATWKAKVSEVATAARSQAATAAPADEAELRELREKVAGLQAKLTMRDAASARAAKLADEERRRWQKEAQDVIVKSARERKSDEAARLASMQAEWSKESARELALTTARAEAAEAALTQMRIRAAEEAPLHRELASAKSALAIREAEVEHLRLQLPAEGDEPLDAQATAAPIAVPREKSSMREVLIAAVIGLAAVTFWPEISALIFGAPPAPPTKAPEPVAEVVPALPVATATKEAKLRAEPSTKAAVVGKLARDAIVEIVETQNGWSRVRFTTPPAKGQAAEGWTKTSVLQESPDSSPTAAKKP
jgi:colicin import membrane protein